MGPKGFNDDDDTYDDNDDGEEIDDEGVAVVKDIGAVGGQVRAGRRPRGGEAFGTLAVGAVDASCERLLALVESSPAHSTPALRCWARWPGSRPAR